MIEKLAAGNRVDLAAVRRVQEELAKLSEAGIDQPDGYSITPPLGRPMDSTQRLVFVNAQPEGDGGGRLGLVRR